MGGPVVETAETTGPFDNEDYAAGVRSMMVSPNAGLVPAR